MFDWLAEHPDIAFAFCLLWVGGVILASILVRRAKGKPLIPRLPADARFSERWASGASLRNVLTQLGGGQNCLLVAVTDKELIVVPRFPFNLMFLPEIWGLEYRAPLGNVTVEGSSSGLLGNRVRLRIRDGRRDSVRFELRLRKREAFLAALAGSKG